MSTERSDWSGAGIDFERHVAMVPIQLGELHLVVELYCSSSSVGMICLVRRTVVFAVVMSTFLQICVESALRVTTKLNIQLVDPSTNLMMCAALSSSRMVSNWDRLAKSIFCCGCTIGSTLSSISSLTCWYLWLPTPLNTSLCLSRMCWRVVFNAKMVFLHSQSALVAKGVRTGGISWYDMCWISIGSGGSIMAWSLIYSGLSFILISRIARLNVLFLLRRCCCTVSEVT